MDRVFRRCCGGPKDGEMIELMAQATTWYFPIVQLQDGCEQPELTFKVAEYAVCPQGHLHYIEPLNG